MMVEHCPKGHYIGVKHLLVGESKVFYCSQCDETYPSFILKETGTPNPALAKNHIKNLDQFSRPPCKEIPCRFCPTEEDFKRLVEMNIKRNKEDMV